MIRISIEVHISWECEKRMKRKVRQADRPSRIVGDSEWVSQITRANWAAARIVIATTNRSSTVTSI